MLYEKCTLSSTSQGSRTVLATERRRFNLLEVDVQFVAGVVEVAGVVDVAGTVDVAFEPLGGYIALKERISIRSIFLQNDQSRAYP
jgi:hypothetical protein